jgi:hypothetical protein
VHARIAILSFVQRSSISRANGEGDEHGDRVTSSSKGVALERVPEERVAALHNIALKLEIGANACRIAPCEPQCTSRESASHLESLRLGSSYAKPLSVGTEHR